MLTLCLDRVGSLRNAPSAAGPTPMQAPTYADFQKFATDLRMLQQADLLNLSYENAKEQPSLILEVRGLSDPPNRSIDCASCLGLAKTGCATH